jgi:hypothetical protein
MERHNGATHELEDRSYLKDVSLSLASSTEASSNKLVREGNFIMRNKRQNLQKDPCGGQWCATLMGWNHVEASLGIAGNLRRNLRRKLRETD